MVKGELNAGLLQVRIGALAFDRFARDTLVKWQHIARGLLRRWKVPSWVTQEDVTQDLLLAAWRLVQGWDPTKGTTIEEFVIWNAIDVAKKRIHKARLGQRPHRGEEQMRSRFERPLSSFISQDQDHGSRSDDATTDHVLDRLAGPSDQHEVLEIKQACEVVRLEATTMPELIAVQAISINDGDVIAAASLLYRDVDARFICELGSEAQAMSLACEAAQRVAAVAMVA